MGFLFVGSADIQVSQGEIEKCVKIIGEQIFNGVMESYGLTSDQDVNRLYEECQRIKCDSFEEIERNAAVIARRRHQSKSGKGRATF